MYEDNPDGVQFSFSGDLQEAARRRIEANRQAMLLKKKQEEEAAAATGGAIGTTAGTAFGATPWGAATGGPAVWGPLGGMLGTGTGKLFG